MLSLKVVFKSIKDSDDTFFMDSSWHERIIMLQLQKIAKAACTSAPVYDSKVNRNEMNEDLNLSECWVLIARTCPACLYLGQAVS